MNAFQSTLARLVLYCGLWTAVAGWGPAFGQALQNIPIQPNETDLKAAYCIGALSNRTALAKRLLSSQDIQQERNGRVFEQIKEAMQRDEISLRRVRAYLVPRSSYLEPSGLLAAEQTARMDFTNSTEQLDLKAAERVNACSDPSFLPF